MGTAAAVVGGSIISGALGARGAEKAAGISAAGQREAAQIAAQQQAQTRADLSPFRQAGVTALGQLGGFGQSRVDPSQFLPQEQLQRFDPSQVGQFIDPGFQFRQQEQERAIGRQSAGMGKFLSGNRLEEILKRSGELASQEYGQAFGRAVTTQQLESQRQQAQFGQGLSRFGIAQGQESDYLTRLQNLASGGQAAAGLTGQFGAQAAGMGAQAATQAANAQAAAQLAQSQALQGTMGNIAMFAGQGGFQQPVRQFTAV
jgi:hypothetical protein